MNVETRSTAESSSCDSWVGSEERTERERRDKKLVVDSRLELTDAAAAKVILMPLAAVDDEDDCGRLGGR